MTDVTRRGFLKAIGAITAGSLVIPAFSLITPAAAIPAGLEWFGSARELIQYDIAIDEFFFRIDIATRNEQLGCDFRIRGNTQDQLLANLARARDVATERIRDEAASRSIGLADLVRLPVPDDYKEPWWMRQIDPVGAA
jgi:hypothetical protein